ncbi:MAG: TIGR03960 family B12-binding radical SAM protein, partial [Candidatus Omnitrophica bacterium]|nr:TIGR03960 family B12-binding radical SAM protein [Candidatus Omnitrophota bacterium]
MLDDILSQVQKPARYMGQEWNVAKKDFDKSYIKFALCFPDLYEVGMSNLGIRIIYGILNSLPDTCCERFFSCAGDMEQVLRSRHIQILSLESRKRLAEFDIIGFSLASELNYTNVLNILDLGGITLEASLRGRSEPLVIAGGPAVLNPEPMHKFFDLFVIGEAEDLIVELIELYRKYKEKYKGSRISKQGFLFLCSQIPGVYAPSLYKVTYNTMGAIEEFRPEVEGAPLKIKKRIVKDFNSSFFPLDWLVPYIQTIHDRVTLEIMRGCPNSCRFCQARSQYFPLRFRDRNKILNLAEEAYKRTGYEELSLGGLSVGDYTDIEGLLKGLMGLFKPKGVSVSLPSIKAKAQTGTLLSLIAKVKKTGLTFAPESGSERLREILAKDFNEQVFFKMIEEAYSSGYQHLKLYFMIGLPFEEQKDLDGIIDFARRTSELKRKINKFPAQVNISINTLIPKPHTPLQWFGMADLESVKYKQDYLKDKARNKRLIFSFHNRYMGFLEGVLSRGDRRLSEV